MEKAIFILSDRAFSAIYPQDIYREISERVALVDGNYTAESIQQNLDLLQDVTIIFSGWGAPLLDEAFLAHAPNLKAVFYGAGSVRQMASSSFWERDILLTNAVSINAGPVAYFTLAEILFALKGGWHHIRFRDMYKTQPHLFGIKGSTVGILSLGYIGRRVCDLLRPLDINLLIYDPCITEEQAMDHGGTLSDIEMVFRKSDVVSLHTPLLDETFGMITGEHFEMMKAHSTFINTARGAIIRENEMIAALQKRTDVIAVLDVTYPEPPSDDSPLLTMPNVVLTPHIAGATGANEVREFGVLMLEELDRYLNQQPLQYRITEKQAKYMA